MVCNRVFVPSTRRDRPPFFLSTKNSRSQLQHYLDVLKDFTNKSTVDQTEIKHLCIENSDLPAIPGLFIVKPRDVLIGGGKGIYLSRTPINNSSHFSQIVRVPTILRERRKWDCRYLAWIIRNDTGDIIVNFSRTGIIRTAGEVLGDELTLKQILTNIGFQESDPESFVPPELTEASDADVRCMTEIMQKMCIRVVTSYTNHPALVVFGLDIVEGWCIEINHHPFMSFTATDAEGEMCRIAGRMISSDLDSLFN